MPYVALSFSKIWIHVLVAGRVVLAVVLVAVDGPAVDGPGILSFLLATGFYY